jgi:hypothetical protein
LYMLAVLIPGYGLFYCYYLDGLFNWYSANSPFTSVQKAALGHFELSRDGYAYVATTREVFATRLGTNIKTTVRSEAQFLVDLPDPGDPGLPKYTIRALGMNHSIIQGLSVIAGRSYPAALCATYLQSGGGLTRKYYAGWDIYPSIAWISNYAGNWYTTTLDGIMASRVLRVWSGDFNTPGSTIGIPGASYQIPHVHARSADFIFAMGDGLSIFDQGGTNLVTTYAGIDKVDCDPTGMTLLHLKQDYLGISTDQGANWTDLTANLEFIPKYTPVVLNMGDALTWFISFNDEGGFLRTYMTSDAGETWVDAIGNLHSMSDSNAVLTVAHYA